MRKAAKVLGEKKVEVKDRPLRRTAYLPIKLKKSRWLPFFQMDAQLLDLSPSGAKVQCGRDISAWQGSSVWVEIPLLTPSDLGETVLFVETECRWYDEEALAMGIHFMVLSDEEAKVLNQLIDDLRQVGRLAC